MGNYDWVLCVMIGGYLGYTYDLHKLLCLEFRQEQWILQICMFIRWVAFLAIMFKESSDIKTIITGDVISVIFLDYRRCKGSWLFTMALFGGMGLYVNQGLWLYWMLAYKRVLIETKKHHMVIPKIKKK